MTDIILILILIVFLYSGWKRGLVKTLLELASTLISLVLSMIFYNPISKFINESPLGEFVRENVYKILTEQGEQLLKTDAAVENASVAVINTISFIIIIILAKILVTVLSEVLNIAAKFPVIKQANKLLGATIGLVSGLLTCYIVIGVLKNLSANAAVSQIIESIKNSAFAVKFYDNNFVSDMLSKYL